MPHPSTFGRTAYNQIQPPTYIDFANVDEAAARVPCYAAIIVAN